MTSASRSSQARSTRLTLKSGRWVSRCPRDRASRSQFRARTSSDRGRPARFGASLGSLTTTRPIVRPNCLPVRTRFIPAGSTNPIFCCPCCPCDRQSRLQVHVPTRLIPPRSVLDLSISHRLEIQSADQLGPVCLGSFRVSLSPPARAALQDIELQAISQPASGILQPVLVLPTLAGDRPLHVRYDERAD